MQPLSAAECLPSDGAHQASDDAKLVELSFEYVFQFLNEMDASPGTDMFSAEQVSAKWR